MDDSKSVIQALEVTDLPKELLVMIEGYHDDFFQNFTACYLKVLFGDAIQYLNLDLIIKDSSLRLYSMAKDILEAYQNFQGKRDSDEEDLNQEDLSRRDLSREESRSYWFFSSIRGYDNRKLRWTRVSCLYQIAEKITISTFCQNELNHLVKLSQYFLSPKGKVFYDSLVKRHS